MAPLAVARARRMVPRVVPALVAVVVLAFLLALSAPPAADGSTVEDPQAAAATAERAAPGAPNIFFYNLDDLRDAFPGAIDPLQFMPKTRAWMANARRYTQTFVADPSCCPSRASMMTGRYPHNNGVRDQQDGPQFDGPHSMACYLRSAGYSTYFAGKFLTTWPKTSLPPCFDRSTVMWGGYRNVSVRVDGAAQTGSGYSTTYLGNRGRQYIDQALAASTPRPFLLYEAPQAPHWATINNPDGSVSKLAVPDTPYASAPVGTCSGVPEADRSDKPAYVRKMNHTTAQAQAMCQSQLRAIMSADDQFAATMQKLDDEGVLDDTLVIFSSDNGYMWGEHGRWEKFVPYEPSIRVPLLVRWPGHVTPGTDTTRLVSYLDLLPTMLQAAGYTLPASAPRLDGESLLGPSGRSTMYAEYYVDGANPNIPSWRMVRTATAKYVQTYNASGGVIAREYYNLVADPAENTNLLGDASTGNDPPASTITTLTNRLNTFATCTGASCVTGTSGGAAAVAVEDDLVLHYPMETLVGGVVPDQSASALDGRAVAASGAPRLVTGLSGYGRALQLTGASHQWVDVPLSPALDVDTYTLSAWVRYTGVENDATLGRWEVLEKAGAYWMNVRTNGRVRVGGFYGGCTNPSWQYLDSSSALPVNRWKHVAATYDGARLRVYVDGRSVGTKRTTGRTCVSGEPLAVGAKNNPSKGLLEAFWDGRLDEVRIYDRALSATEIGSLAARP